MAKNPQQDAQKWATNIGASTQRITDGVNAVTVNPAQKAIAAKAKMQANFTASMAAGGKFDTSMGKVTLDGWKQAMLTIGVQKISTGATAAIPKMANFLTKLYAYQDSYLPAIRAMVNNNYNDAKAKMNANFDKMAAAKGKLK